MFLVPEIDNENNGLDPLRNFYLRERKKGKIFEYPHIQMESDKENNFWTEILLSNISNLSKNYNQNLKELDLNVCTQVNLMIKQRRINLYSAIRYFWNRLAYYKSKVLEDEIARDYDRIKIERIDFNLDKNIYVEPVTLILPIIVQKIPMVLVPNLVSFLYEHFLRRNRYRNYNLMFRNNFKELLNYPYPKIRIVTKKSKKKKGKILTKEYHDRKNNSDDFISSKMILELTKQLNSSQKREVFSFLEKL